MRKVWEDDGFEAEQQPQNDTYNTFSFIKCIRCDVSMK